MLAGIVTTYQRSCSCRGVSASGPRLVMRHDEIGDLHDADATIQVTALMAVLACDRCDEPWSLVEVRK